MSNMSKSDDVHEWRIGDLCFKTGYPAVVWRVIDVEIHSSGASALWIKPVFYTMGAQQNRRTHEVSSNDCSFVDIVNLCTLRSEIDGFISAEAKRLGIGENPTAKKHHGKTCA